jgi:hypothetical protein
MKDLRRAAKKCLDSVSIEEPASLDRSDRNAMIGLLRAQGIEIAAERSDAYVAKRFDAEWDESAHPRGEGGKFGEGSGGAKIAAEHLGIGNLTTRGSDALDFHEVHVGGVKSALNAAHVAAGGGPIDHATAESIASKHLGMHSLTPKGRDGSDFHEVSTNYVRSALTAAHEAGAAKGSFNARLNPDGARASIAASDKAKAASAAASKAKTPAAHMAAAAAHREAAEAQRKFGGFYSEKAAKQSEGKAAKHEAKAAAAPTAAAGAQSHAEAAHSALSSLKASSDPTQSYRSGQASEAAKAATVAAGKERTSAGHMAAAAAQRSAAEAQRLAGNSALAATHASAAAGHEAKATKINAKAAAVGSTSTDPKSLAQGRAAAGVAKSTTYSPLPGDHPSLEKRVARFPVGAKVTTAAAGQTFSPEHGKSMYGTVQGHDRSTGKVIVKFENGHVGHEAPYPHGIGLSKVHK